MKTGNDIERRRHRMEERAYRLSADRRIKKPRGPMVKLRVPLSDLLLEKVESQANNDKLRTRVAVLFTWAGMEIN